AAGSVFTRASAQSWPSRPLRWVVPFPAGSSPDITARIIAAKLTDSLGQNIVIENRTGAAGIIGADLVAKAAPDGYTMLYPVNSVICANPHLYSKLPYDGLKSFVPVTMTVRFGYVLLARPDFPANDVAGLIAAAKAQPGKFNFGSAGVGAGNHIVMEMLLDATGMRMVHVPHRDSAMSVATGESDLSMVPATTAVPLVTSGKGKPLGVSLPRRLAALPQVPAIAETVPGYSGDAWHGLLAPAGTPADITERVAAETAKILAMPDVQKRLTDIGLTPVGNAPAQFAATVKSDFDRWGAAIRKANIKLD
ncbi:MAG: Bug family tripartite tricarboxylate transporter substrate binding protein, partial [Betaproteobacteria bacterium]